ncbi:MAG: PQQ-dependent sugar dehydrogenase [Candidatus Shapirobacteria bacterium]|nr:PQQ-dependent sugar dehydrogenase [Candidatus Shapirobacteria bacterium]MDD5073572.1 PQQ-dependent sugar dehydrogenase [Candidatus Shapirobacteria bacterium]MDD5481325.1 PQQ-dependent sugar dehydrogenase [Candidatus Shapirobacteria bacterium]
MKLAILNKKTLFFLISLLLFIFIVGVLFLTSQFWSAEPSSPAVQNRRQKNDLDTVGEEAKITVVAEELTVPWGIAFLPNGDLLVTERPGRVRLVNGQGLRPEPVLALPNVVAVGEGGLLGIAPHPNFSDNGYVYLYYTYRDGSDQLLNQVSRMVYRGDRLEDEQVIVAKIPGAANHNGGRIKFGPDGYLYIATGDTGKALLSQDINSLAGKILRLTDEGGAPQDNPFGNLVYSYGHRNPQGLVWDDQGRLWATEHGRSGPLSGLDELNLIQAGGNYGWPIIEGDEEEEAMISPVIHSGPDITWAPSGALFYQDSIFFAGLRGQALYQFLIATGELRVHLQEEFGRIREAVLGPDNFLYFATSNRDGRGSPILADDRIIKINSKLFLSD